VDKYVLQYAFKKSAKPIKLADEINQIIRMFGG